MSSVLANGEPVAPSATGTDTKEQSATKTAEPNQNHIAEQVANEKSVMDNPQQQSNPSLTMEQSRVVEKVKDEKCSPENSAQQSTPSLIKEPTFLPKVEKIAKNEKSSTENSASVIEDQKVGEKAKNEKSSTENSTSVIKDQKVGEKVKDEKSSAEKSVLESNPSLIKDEQKVTEKAKDEKSSSENPSLIKEDLKVPEKVEDEKSPTENPITPSNPSLIKEESKVAEKTEDRKCTTERPSLIKEEPKVPEKAEDEKNAPSNPTLIKEEQNIAIKADVDKFSAENSDQQSIPSLNKEDAKVADPPVKRIDVMEEIKLVSDEDGFENITSEELKIQQLSSEEQQENKLGPTSITGNLTNSTQMETLVVEKENNENNSNNDGEVESVDAQDLAEQIMNMLNDGKNEITSSSQDLLRQNVELHEFMVKLIKALKEKIQLCTNLEHQNTALISQAQSLKDVISITKDLLGIRNMEVEHLHTDMNCMEGRIKEERERHNTAVARLNEAMTLNDKLKAEYLVQMDLFQKLRDKYNEKVVVLTRENQRLLQIVRANGLENVVIPDEAESKMEPVINPITETSEEVVDK